MGLATVGAGISAGAGLLGGILGAGGASTSAQATAQADYYQAQVAANNAQIASQNATATMGAGELTATNSGLQARAKLGTMTASMGANGVDVNTGSNAAVRAGADQTSMLDALTIRSNAARQAYGYQVQATSDTAQGQLDPMAGDNAEKAGSINAQTSLLSGASSVGRAFASYQNQAGLGTSGGGKSNSYGLGSLTSLGAFNLGLGS